MSQAELARRIDTAPQVVNRWFKKLSDPNLHTVSEVARALKCEPWELLYEHSGANGSARMKDLTQKYGQLLKERDDFASEVMMLREATKAMSEKIRNLESRTQDNIKQLNPRNDSPELLDLFDRLRSLAKLDQYKLVEAGGLIHTLETEPVKGVLKNKKSLSRK